MSGFAAVADVLAQSVEDLEKIDEAIDTSAVTAWEIVAALVILVVAWPVSSLVARLMKRASRRIPGTPDYVPELVGRSARVLVVVVALAWAMSLLGVEVGWFALVITFIAIITILMVRPLIENLAAGLLLQSRPSFSVGDEIASNGYVGDVIQINARSTVIRTRDGRSVHIPNEDVLGSSIDVYTSFERRRSSLELGIDYAVDPDHASEVLIAAVHGVDGVLADPPPAALARGFGDGTVILNLRWWHAPDLRAENHVRDRVVRAVRRAVNEAGIDMPSPELRIAATHEAEVPPSEDSG